MLKTILIAIVVAGLPASGQVLQDVQRSHIEANVPGTYDFTRLLRRDLGEYFAKQRGGKAVPVDFELLRDGPTQSGVSYPKFYIWVRVAGGKSIDDRGVVRVAAVERERFEITDYVSERAIRGQPDEIYRTFPAAVCQTIEAKLAATK